MARYLFSYDLHVSNDEYESKKTELRERLEARNGFRIEDDRIASTFVLEKGHLDGTLEEVLNTRLHDFPISYAAAEVDGLVIEVRKNDAGVRNSSEVFMDRMERIRRR